MDGRFGVRGDERVPAQEAKFKGGLSVAIGIYKRLGPTIFRTCSEDEVEITGPQVGCHELRRFSDELTSD